MINTNTESTNKHEICVECNEAGNYRIISVSGEMLSLNFCQDMRQKDGAAITATLENFLPCYFAEFRAVMNWLEQFAIDAGEDYDFNRMWEALGGEGEHPLTLYSS